MVYFIFSYLRNTIEEYHTETGINARALSGKNNILKNQNTLIREQSSQLEKKQILLIEAADFQQRISSLLSHDIRTSVMAFKNIFASYRKGYVAKEELIEYVPILEKEADNMNTLFEDILSLSNEETIKTEKHKEKIDPEKIIKEICLAYTGTADNKNIGLHYSISSSKQVFANPKFVKIILRNLISNAIKFTQPGGNIRISNSINDKKKYIITVQDNGEGMSPEKLEKIRRGISLTTVGTSNEKGTGLGLSFCREFVSKCGGTLEVCSELGKGTTFSFTLPLPE
jgi:signal transduction histidine kinase